jgi:hypothetical protein
MAVEVDEEGRKESRVKRRELPPRASNVPPVLRLLNPSVEYRSLPLAVELRRPGIILERRKRLMEVEFLCARTRWRAKAATFTAKILLAKLSLHLHKICSYRLYLAFVGLYVQLLKKKIEENT